MSDLVPPPWDPQLSGQPQPPQESQSQPPAAPQPSGAPQPSAAAHQPVNPPGTYPPPAGTQYGTVQYTQPPAGYSGTPYPPNYGQYGPGPYGYGGGGYGQPPGTSGMAIASLILGICGFFCVTPFIGLGLGIAALAQTSKTGQSGKGMAIAGVILSAAWIVLGALLIATGHFHVSGGTGSGPSTGPTQGTNGTSA